MNGKKDMNLPKEIELKYRADNIKLADFAAFCEARKPDRFLTASGFDHFYSSKKDLECFARHRVEPGKFNQLSFKRKLADKNNFIRVEHNITLGLDVTVKQVSQLMGEFGYEYGSSLFKHCDIYTYPLYTLVHYVVYDSNLKELDRFLEVEMSEEHAWKDDQEAWDMLTAIEKELEPLGISPQNRIKRSLYEMFVKKDVSK